MATKSNKIHTERERASARTHTATQYQQCEMYTRIGIRSTSIIDGTAQKMYKHPNYFSAIKQFDKKRFKKNETTRADGRVEWCRAERRAESSTATKTQLN